MVGEIAGRTAETFGGLLLRGAAAALLLACAAGVLPAQQAVELAPPVPVPTAEPEAGRAEGPLPAPHGLPPPRPGLTLAEIEARALAANPSLQRAAALVGAARGTWIQAGLLPNPTVGYDGQQLGSGGRAEQHGLVFNQEFVTGGKLGLNQAVADRELALARQAWESQRLRVLTDAKLAYYQVLAAQRQIDLTHKLLQTSQEGADKVRALLRGMEVGKADLLQAELEVETYNIALQNARQRHLAAWRILATVTGDPKLPMQPLAGDLFASTPPIEYDLALATLRGASSEIATAALNIERAEAALARARADSVPNVTVQGLLNVQDQGIDGKTDGGVAVTLPWPLFNRNQGNILRAEHEVAAAVQALHQVELDLTRRFAGVFERYASARYQVERYREKLLPAAEESLALTRKAYEAREVSFISVLTAQRTAAQVQLNYLEAVQTLRLAEAEIEGQLLRDSLAPRD